MARLESRHAKWMCGLSVNAEWVVAAAAAVDVWVDATIQSIIWIKL